MGDSSLVVLVSARVPAETLFSSVPVYGPDKPETVCIEGQVLDAHGSARMGLEQDVAHGVDAIGER